MDTQVQREMPHLEVIGHYAEQKIVKDLTWLRGGGCIRGLEGVGEKGGHKPRQQPCQQRLFGGESGQKAAQRCVHLDLLLGPEGGVGSARSAGYVQALL